MQTTRADVAMVVVVDVVVVVLVVVVVVVAVELGKEEKSRGKVPVANPSASRAKTLFTPSTGE